MRPTWRLLLIITCWAALGFATSLENDWQFAWQVTGMVILLIVIREVWVTNMIAPPDAERNVAGSMSLHVWHTVTLRLSNPTQRPYQVAVFDHYPVNTELSGLPQQVEIPPERWVEVEYKIRPTQRGDLFFDRTQILFHSPLKLFQQSRFCGQKQSVKVYPNFSAITKFALLATDNHVSQLGIKKHQRRGEGLEFLQLREYRDGDSMRQIDWKATSRYRKLISREYQDERDQQIVFLIDAGRHMRTQDGEISHFDHALNAMLLLAYVALRQGDAVGLLAFGGSKRWLPPKKGAGVINTILNTVYDLHPKTHAADYTAAATEFMQRQNKRSLVILLTNAKDEDSDALVSAMQMLKRRHLVLVASLREKVIDEVLNEPIQDFNGALDFAAAQQYLAARQGHHENLHNRGSLVLDVIPEKLPIAIVNRYLDIKRSGRL